MNRRLAPIVAVIVSVAGCVGRSNNTIADYLNGREQNQANRTSP
jgi:hypothetical protein